MDKDTDKDTDKDKDKDTNTNNDEDIPDLDVSWLEDFDNLDDEYKNYYREDLSFINCFFIYVDSQNNIERIKEEKILFKDVGILTKGELLAIIKHNRMFNDVKYSLISILNYVINIEPKYLNTFLKNEQKYQFLQKITNIDEIHFDKSITTFHDINSLIFLFGHGLGHGKAHTKKLLSCINHKRYTKRKQLKDNNA
jgi:hypothetical protein